MIDSDSYDLTKTKERPPFEEEIFAKKKLISDMRTE
jgi:hypothetical protein